VTAGAETNEHVGGGVTTDGTVGGVVSGVTAYLLWGLITIYWKALKEFAPLELVGFRITMSVVFLFVLLATRSRLRTFFRRMRAESLWGRVTLASALLAGNWATYVVVIHEGRVIEAALGYFIAPLGTMLLGVKVLREHLRPRQMVSASLATIAVLVLTISYGRLPVYALAMAITWSIYGLLKRQISLTPLESLASETIVLMVPGLALVLWHLQDEGSVFRSASAAELVLVSLSGVITAVPLVLFAHASQRLPLTVLGPMQYLVPIINFLLGWLAYHETLNTSRIIGFALVWIALLLVTVDTLNEARVSRSVA